MTLRTKLVFALMLAAILPMLVAVAVSVLKAESRAQAHAVRRLEAAKRQASILVDRSCNETRARVDQAAVDFGNDRTAFDSLLGASRPSAGDLARRLAEVHGLDRAEILDAAGTVLSASRAESGVGTRSAFADLPDRGTIVREIADERGNRTPRLVVAARGAAVRGADTFPVAAPRPATRGEEDVLFVVGTRVIGQDLLSEIAEVSGEWAALVDTAGRMVMAAEPAAEENGDGSASSDRTNADSGSNGVVPYLISGDVPLGSGGWRVRVAAPAGDVRETRRELLGIFAGIAPFALASALIIGAILAEGFSRPIRTLALRAEEISARNREPFSIPPERNEVRRLTASFDRMLEALSDGARRRVAAERIAAWQEVARRIAHEVKNPLSPIKLAVENLRRTRAKAPADFDRALEEETTTILEEVESLRHLVDEFSQFARLPRPQPVACDPREVVAAALALFAPRFEEAGIRVACDIDADAPRSVIADPEQIGRVLKNVLANAVEALTAVVQRPITPVIPASHGDGRDAVVGRRLFVTVRSGSSRGSSAAQGPSGNRRGAFADGQISETSGTTATFHGLRRRYFDAGQGRRDDTTVEAGALARADVADEGPRAGSWEVEVRDTGVGFEPGVEGRIFEPYFTTRGDRGGTGLGMAIAYRIVTDHGGTIHARGAPGCGATITIRLPVDGPEFPA